MKTRDNKGRFLKTEGPEEVEEAQIHANIHLGPMNRPPSMKMIILILFLAWLYSAYKIDMKEKLVEHFCPPQNGSNPAGKKEK